MLAVVPWGQPLNGSRAAGVGVAEVIPPAAPPGQLFGAATSLPSVFQTQQRGGQDMDVDPR